MVRARAKARREWGAVSSGWLWCSWCSRGLKQTAEEVRAEEVGRVSSATVLGISLSLWAPGLAVLLQGPVIP